MRSSDSGAPELSPPTRWRMRERTDSDDTTTPGVRAGSAEVKKYFSSKMPRGVAMYLLEVTHDRSRRRNQGANSRGET